MTRHCVTCGRELVRRSDEQNGNFKKRKTCGRECQKAVFSALRRQAAPQLPTRWCLHCGKVLERGHIELFKDFSRRKTCGPACEEVMCEATKPEARHCVVCGRELVRRFDELAGNFKKRQTCDSKCVTTLRATKRKQLPSRNCRACGRELTRRLDESIGNFKKRQTCDLACKKAAREVKRTRLRGELLPARNLRGDLLPVRECLHCGEILKIRPHEQPYQFKRRKSCRAACQYKLGGRARTKYHGPMVKMCVVCGEPFARTRQSVPNFKAQTTCSSVCSGQRRRVQGAPRQSCAVCGDPLVRRPTEIHAVFLKRTTCKAACAKENVRRERVKIRLEKIQRLPERSCASCGTLLAIREDEHIAQFLSRVTCAAAACLRAKAAKMVNYHGVILPLQVVYEIEGTNPGTTYDRIKHGRISGVHFVGVAPTVPRRRRDRR